MRTLVVGSGAREHALVRALSRDPGVTEVVAAPGNPGMAGEPGARCVGLDDPTDGAAVADLAEQLGADLVVVGPEAPLVAGVADAVRARGVRCVGPAAEAARLEGSKAFAKEVMAAAAVPTARSQVCADEAQLRDALDSIGAPFVVKHDGLAAGKGVVVTEVLAEALEHGVRCLSAGRGARVVVEEFLDGPEVSLFCLTDGRTVLPLAPAQDFKRAHDGDTGPNTGGMGAYSPLPWAPDGLVEEVLRRVARPTVAEMARRGTPFSGVLYVGLALTSRGPRVVEFNARFGDPETQVVLARLRTPLGQVLRALADGRLEEVQLTWSPHAAVTVVLAAPGYPSATRPGGEVTGLAEAAAVEGVHVLHAGTRQEGGRLVASGGRVLSVVAEGEQLATARDRAYRAVARLGLPGGHYRTDIAEVTP